MSAPGVKAPPARHRLGTFIRRPAGVTCNDAATRGPRRPLGFSVIEIVVALAIVAILAALALPALPRRRSARPARRSPGWAASGGSHPLERVATRTGSYLHDEAEFPQALTTVPSGTYAIGFKPSDAKGSGYTLTATPRGAQVGFRPRQP